MSVYNGFTLHNNKAEAQCTERDLIWFKFGVYFFLLNFYLSSDEIVMNAYRLFGCSILFKSMRWHVQKSKYTEKIDKVVYKGQKIH